MTTICAATALNPALRPAAAAHRVINFPVALTVLLCTMRAPKFLCVVLCACAAYAQESAPPPPAAPAVQQMVDQVAAASSHRLLVAPGDEVDISVYGAPELSAHTRVNSDGTVYLPLAGLIKVGGLSSEQAQSLIRERLIAGNFVKDPQVSFFVKEYTGEGISISGEVAHPGFFSALGPHRLLDIIQLAGGLTVTAGRKVIISHRKDPQDAQIVMLSSDPLLLAQQNVELQPGDTVVVSKAGVVYILGEVSQPGGYTIDETQPATVLKLISLAKGPTPNAALKRATVLHRSGGAVTESKVPLQEIMHARAGDMQLQPDDILVVPGRHHMPLANPSVLQTITTLALYRGF